MLHHKLFYLHPHNQNLQDQLLWIIIACLIREVQDMTIQFVLQSFLFPYWQYQFHQFIIDSSVLIFREIQYKYGDHTFISQLMNNNSYIFSSGIRSDSEGQASKLSEKSETYSNISQGSKMDSKSFVQSILQLRKQFSAIKKILRKHKLNEDKLQMALSWGLEKVFQFRCPQLLQRRKNFFNNCDNFFKRMGQVDQNQAKEYPRETTNIVQQEINNSISEDLPYNNNLKSSVAPQTSTEQKDTHSTNKTISLQNQEPINPLINKISTLQNNINIDEIQQKHLSTIYQPTQQQNYISQKSQKPYPKQEEKKQKKGEEEEEEKKKEEEEKKKEEEKREKERIVEVRQNVYTPEDSFFKKKLEDVHFHIMWENKAAFHVQDKTITKLHNDDYRKICALEPFKDNVVYKIKFTILRMGTIAFGIVSKQNKSGLFVDDRYTDTLKFITFFNRDGGKMKLNGEQLQTGRSLAMRQGESFEFTYDPKESKVFYKAPKMRQSKVVQIPCFKGQEMYPYVEMKQKGTTIQFK